MTTSFTEQMAAQTAETYRNNPEVPDHRQDHPWLTGWLGEPTKPVWLVAENPSATQVDRVHSANSTIEDQWSASPGDRLLRQALLEHGLKTGSLFSPGGWNCDITDVMKSEVVVGMWNLEKAEAKRRLAEVWAPVLRYELEHGKPQVLIVMGAAADAALTHLERDGLIPRLPPRRRINHYSYIMSRPAGGVGPGHPQRQTEWKATLREAAQL